MQKTNFGANKVKQQAILLTIICPQNSTSSFKY